MKTKPFPRPRYIARVIPNDPRALSIVQTLPDWRETPAFFAVYAGNCPVPPYQKGCLLNGFNSKAKLAEFCAYQGIALAPAVGPLVQSPGEEF